MIVGTNVYIKNRYNWYSGTVIKVTASGLIDVQLACGQNPIYRFNKDGWERGARFDGYSIDKDLPFHARTEWLDKVNRLRAIANKIGQIQGKVMYSSFGGRVSEKEALQEEVNRLQGLLDVVTNLLLEVK